MSAEQKTDDNATAQNMMSDIVNMVTECYNKLDKRQMASLLFDNLCSADPAILARFDGKNLKLLATSFIGIMTIILDDLKTMDIKACDAKMRALGGRHVGYGIGVNMFSTFQACMLDALAKVMGDKFTPKLRYAWAFTWSTFVTTPVSIGWQQAAKMERAKALETVTASFEGVSKESGFADALFERFFGYDSSAKALFGTADMAKHKEKLVGFIAKGLKMAASDDPDGEMAKMAAFHKAKKVQVSHFIFFEESILYALRATLKEKFTGDLADAWCVIVHNEFVEKMVMAPFKEIEAKLVEADADADGIVTLKEWTDTFKAMDMGFDDAALKKSYEACDADGNGTVEAIEFVRMLSRQQLAYPNYTLKEHMKAFVESC